MFPVKAVLANLLLVLQLAIPSLLSESPHELAAVIRRWKQREDPAICVPRADGTAPFMECPALIG